MVMMVPAMPMAVPTDAAQAVIGPHDPATRMIIIGVVVAGIIRVVAATIEEVAMMMMEEAAVMKAAAVEGGTAVKSVEAATMEPPTVETAASAVETSPTMEATTTAVEAAATTMEATAAVEAASAVEAAATMPATVNLGHEPVGRMIRRPHGLRCDQRHRSRGPVRRRDQNQHCRRKADKAESPICNRRHG
jgi:hypothetical protein